MKILIAEDNFTSRVMLLAVLKKWKFNPIATENGAEAWNVMQRADAPKLVLLNGNMPEMDGLEVTRRVRGMSAAEPPYIVILTARGEKSNIVQGLEAGANDYVAKPYDHDELRARLGVGRRMVELQSVLALRMRELQKAQDDIKTLRGIIPICANCKNIRDDKGCWSQVEVYVRDHSEAEFSHGLCPVCVKKLYSEFAPGRRV